MVAYALVKNLPFDKPGRFYRGNLHAHSADSDGTRLPEELAGLYKEAGEFLAITDHFRERYGFPVTDTRSSRSEGFTTLLAAELHAPETRLGVDWHILAVGLPPDFPPRGPSEGGPDLARRAVEAGAFVGIAHPAWYGLTPKTPKPSRARPTPSRSTTTAPPRITTARMAGTSQTRSWPKAVA
jgi:hypothetical protein